MRRWYPIEGRWSNDDARPGLRVRRAPVALRLRGDEERRGGMRVARRPVRRSRADPSELLLLGGPRLRRAGVLVELPPVRWVALLAYLARGGGWVRRDALAALFWPDHDDRGASLNLRQTLQTIARSSAGVALEREATRVRWNGLCDVARFDACVRSQAWASALECYRGPFLDGIELDDVVDVHEWIEAERVGLQARWRMAALTLARAQLDAGRCFEALALLERIVADDVFDEEALRAFLRAAVDCGDRTRAMRTLLSVRSTLARDVGVDVDDATLEVARDLGLRLDG